MTEWWRGSVTYQVYPRSFQDSNGDGIGDLPGITSRLDHIARLGVDAVWLSPFFASPMKDMGYDVSDYTAVDPIFGTLKDFDDLVGRAHSLGLKVIIDQVLSHSADTHPAFLESRASRENEKADWYVWADAKLDGSPPNNWLSVFGGSAWQWDARRKQYFLHNFLTSQPDFNFHNRDVQDWHLENMRFWLDRGVDGFRFDTVNYFFHDRQLRDNPVDPRIKTEVEANPYGMQYHLYSKNQPENLGWLERIRNLLDEYDDRASVGEVGESHHAIAMMGEYTAQGRLHQCYSFELMGHDYSPAFFRGKMEEFFTGAPDGWPMWAFSNHDVVRHAGRWGRHGASTDAVAKQAGALLLGFEGSICLWQGEELGQTDTALAFEDLTDPQGIAFWPEPVGRDGTRTPMVWDGSLQAGFTTGTPWLPIKHVQLERNVAGQEGVAGSVLETYRDLIAHRQSTPALRFGRARFLDLPEPLLGFAREHEGMSVLCLFNMGADTVALEMQGARLELRGPCEQAALDSGKLTLGPNGWAFLVPAGG